MDTAQRFEGCRVELRDARGAPLFDDDDADLRLDGAHLTLLYWDDEGAVVFGGVRDEATGVYSLGCRSRPRSASLRRREPDGRLIGFEGDWTEGDERGTWVVTLPGVERRTPSAGVDESIE